MQKEMENAMEWASQDEEVQRDRMGHYKSLQNAARGFLSMAVDALSMLLLLSNNAELCAAGFVRAVPNCPVFVNGGHTYF
jgi:hypothetical protein